MFVTCLLGCMFSNTTHFVSQVRKVRNKTMHAGKYEFTTADMKSHLLCMTSLLQEPVLQTTMYKAAADNAVAEINTVRLGETDCPCVFFINSSISI